MKKALLLLAVLLTTTTAWAETQTVSYIDANGVEQTVNATVLTSQGWYDPGWYVVNGNIEIGYLTFNSGESTNLILADGATLTLNDSGIYAFGAITIYGQKNGTGKFTNIPGDESDYALRANGDINIHGGVIEATGGSEYGIGISTMSWDEEQHITITGGKVTAVGGENCAGIDAHKGNITITGGQVNASGCWGLRIESNNNYLYTITLGCTSESDFICSSSNDGAFVKIIDGQTLVDDEGNEYSGTYTYYLDNYASLFGKKLHLPRAKYDITLPESFEHGMVTCDKQTAAEGETVTLTVTPDNGYELEALTVMNGTTAVAVTPSDEEGKYTFVMPAAAVNVNATFTAIDYTISVADGIVNGTVVANKDVANFGDIVTLTVMPNDGYLLDLLTIATIGDNSVNVDYTIGNEPNTYTFEMPNSPVIISATFSYNPFSQDGNTYTIYAAAGWDVFCDMLEGGETFSGKTVKLGNDISVTRMAGVTGDSSYPFSGTFDGQGKTLTFNYTANENYAAPFAFVKGGDTTDDAAAITHLNVATTITASGYRHMAGLIALQQGHVNVTDCHATVNINSTTGGTQTDLYPAALVSQAAHDNNGTLTMSGCTASGTIAIDGKYAGGLIGIVQGSAKIVNCVSSVTINSSTAGDGTHGGFIAAHQRNNGITIEGCLFNGKLLTVGETATDCCGGFMGWRNGTITIKNSLYAPAELESGETEVGEGSGSHPSHTFYRNDVSAGDSIYNSYYTRTLGTAQGKQCRSITADEYVTVANAGTPETLYNVSGITAYPTGIKYNDVLYAGNSDEVALTLGFSGDENTFAGYEASAGTLSGSDNPYTLTMPDEDVVINANTVAVTVPGDVNGDGSVTASDVTEIYNYLLNGDQTYINTADVNGDGSITSADITAVYSILLGN